jgi:hypothetical protein
MGLAEEEQLVELNQEHPLQSSICKQIEDTAEIKFQFCNCSLDAKKFGFSTMS